MPHTLRRWSLLIALAWMIAPASASAALLHVYDLDSLNYLASDVIEAKVTRRFTAHDLSLIEVEVIAGHKGSLKKGDVAIVAHTDIYRKDISRSSNLGAGDRVVLFLTRLDKEGRTRIPENLTIFEPEAGGMRLIQDDKVIGFQQFSNPGPYVAGTPDDGGGLDLTGNKAPTMKQFQALLADSLRDLKRIAPLLEAKEDKFDTPALLKLLAIRAKGPPSRDRDHISELACRRLANTHDPALLHRALEQAKGYFHVSTLHLGFGTPKGREDLLERINDPKQPLEARLRCARALQEAGAVYRSTFTEIGSGGYRPVGEADEGNSRYLTRIAESAAALRDQEDLGRSLIECVDSFGRGIVQSKSPPMIEDLQGALAVLRKLHSAKLAQPLQFAIEAATANADSEAYARLNSVCGPIITLLSLVDPKRFTETKERSLVFAYSYVTHQAPPGTEFRPSVVLVHQESKRRFVLPSRHTIRAGMGSGGDAVVLPRDLPAGKYHVFYEIRDKGKVISTGHHFEADL